MKFLKYSAITFFAICLLLAMYRHLYIDELFTYQGILNNSAAEIWQYTKFKTANNHVLNSLYVHFLLQAGLRNLFFFRLLSLLCLIPYTAYYYQYVKSHIAGSTDSNRSPEFYLVICLLPYLLPYFTFFSLARGYALAIAAFMASLYYFTTLCRDYTTRSMSRFIIAGLLASIATFSFIYPFVAMLLLAIWYCYKPMIATLKAGKNIAIYALLVVLTVVVCYYVYDKGQIIMANDTGIAGGDNLFKNGMFSSLLSFMAFQDVTTKSVISYPHFFVIMKDAIVVTLIPTLIIFYRQRKFPLVHQAFAATILLLIVSHFIFQSKYPFGRTLSYLPILLYLPLITTYITKNKERIIYNIHFLVLIAAGCWGTFSDLFLAFSSLKK